MAELRQPTVMLVDDVPSNLKVLSDILSGENYDVKSYQSGRQALESAELSPPDLLLLEINMSEMGGFEVASAMQTISCLKNIPIIFISNFNTDEDVIEAFKNGAVDYVNIPFNHHEVLARIAIHLNLHKLKKELIEVNASLEQTLQQRTLSLKKSEDRFSYALSAINEGIYDIDLIQGKIYRNPWLMELIGYDSSEMNVMQEDLLESVHPDDLESYGHFIVSLLGGEKTNCQLRYRIKRIDGIIIWVLNKAQVVEFDNRGNTERVVGTITDITRQVNYENELKRFATHDSITNFPNRLLLRELITQRMQENSVKFGVLYIGFRDVEKIIGSTDHSVAEQAIKQVALRLKTCVNESTILAKLDGPEFVILVNDYVHPSDLASQANLIDYYFMKPIEINSENFMISPHIGISIPDEKDSADIILRNAATAMLHTSEGDGAVYTFHSQSMNLKVRYQICLENSIKKGIENKEFVNFYQPKICLHTGQIMGAEALVRWQHPEQGLVAPFEFIAAAEHSGQIHELGLQIFENALKDLSTWQKELCFMGKVAINLSPKQFNNSESLEIMLGLFEKYQVDPGFVELEITESVLFIDVEHAIKVINKFKALGLTIAIDDFGTGYSSLSYLKKIPFDTLKLDKSFIDEIVTSKKSRILVESIIQLALGLDLDVVAEGVESADQAALLQTMNCAQCQGYLFSKPVDKTSFAKIISNKQSVSHPALFAY